MWKIKIIVWALNKLSLQQNAHKVVALTEFCPFIPLSLTRFVFQENFLTEFCPFIPLSLTRFVFQENFLTEFCPFIPLSLTRFVFQENFLHTAISRIKIVFGGHSGTRIVFHGHSGTRIVFQGHSGTRIVFQGHSGTRIVFQGHSRIRQLKFSEVCCFVFCFCGWLLLLMLFVCVVVCVWGGGNYFLLGWGWGVVVSLVWFFPVSSLSDRVGYGLCHDWLRFCCCRCLDLFACIQGKMLAWFFPCPPVHLLGHFPFMSGETHRQECSKVNVGHWHVPIWASHSHCPSAENWSCSSPKGNFANARKRHLAVTYTIIINRHCDVGYRVDLSVRWLLLFLALRVRQNIDHDVVACTVYVYTHGGGSSHCRFISPLSLTYWGCILVP